VAAFAAAAEAAALAPTAAPALATFRSSAAEDVASDDAVSSTSAAQPIDSETLTAGSTSSAAKQPRPQTSTSQAADDVQSAINQRVTAMLAVATKASESQVGAEIKKLDAGFTILQAKMDKIEALLGFQAKQPGPSEVAQMLTDLDQRWSSEIQAVKRELHQTILAHNHNADLMADHKSAIDKVAADIDSRTANSFGDVEMHSLHSLVATLQESEAQDRDCDAILIRGEALLRRAAAQGTPHAPGLPLPSQPPLTAMPSGRPAPAPGGLPPAL